MDLDLELKVKISRRKLRVLLLHEFRLGHQATASTSNICGTMGRDVLFIRTAQHWFHRFKNGNFELNDLPHTERSAQVNVDVLKELIDEDTRLTNRCLAERVGCSHITVETHVHELGKTWKYGVCRDAPIPILDLELVRLVGIGIGIDSNWNCCIPRSLNTT
jgi:hypothetical protein